MSREELIKIIETLNIKDIKYLSLEFYDDYDYNKDREAKKIIYGKENRVNNDTKTSRLHK